MYYRRLLEDRLTGPVSRNKVRLLCGARQTGKTWLLRRLLAGEDTRAFDLQDTVMRRRFEADPAAFGREVRALPRSVTRVVLDEIQKVPALLDEIQRLYDAAPSRWQFYLTGSLARRLRSGTANLLPGRSHTYHLYPVCGWEVDRDSRGKHSHRSSDAGVVRGALSRGGDSPRGAGQGHGPLRRLPSSGGLGVRAAVECRAALPGERRSRQHAQEYREMDMRFWLKQAEAEMKQLR